MAFFITIWNLLHFHKNVREDGPEQWCPVWVTSDHLIASQRNPSSRKDLSPVYQDMEMHIDLISYSVMKKTRLPILCLFCVNSQPANSSHKKKMLFWFRYLNLACYVIVISQDYICWVSINNKPFGGKDMSHARNTFPHHKKLMCRKGHWQTAEPEAGGRNVTYLSFFLQSPPHHQRHTAGHVSLKVKFVWEF